MASIETTVTIRGEEVTTSVNVAARGPQGIQGEQGETGPTGATGPAGPAPSGTGLVSVTDGVLDTPETLAVKLAADAEANRTALVVPTGSGTSTGTNTGDQDLSGYMAINASLLGFIDATKAPYSVVANGVADNTVAIQAALDTGKDVFLGEGRILISDELKLRAVSTPAGSGVPIIRGQRIFGCGPSRTVLYQSNSAKNIFNISQTSSFYGHIYGIAFEGTGGNTSTGYGIASTGGGPHNSWRIENCYFYWLYAGIRAALEDTQIINCTTDSVTEHIHLEQAVNGAAINQNKIIGHIAVYQAQPTNKRPTVPGKGIIINGGQGHVISGMDAGNEGMVTLIELNGTSSGTIEGISTEMFPYSGQLVSCINGTNAGESRWDVKNCNFVGFGTMNSGDYPIVQGRFVAMPTTNVFASGSWLHGVVKRGMSNELYTVGVAGNTGKPLRTDLYLGASLSQSCLTSVFSEVGSQALPTVTTNNVGQCFQKTNVTGQADAIYRFAKDASDTYFAANLLAYSMDTRGGTGVQLFSGGTPTMTATTGSGNILRGDQAVSAASSPTFAAVNGTTTLNLTIGGTTKWALTNTALTSTSCNLVVNGSIAATNGNITTNAGWYYLINGRGGWTMNADGVMQVLNNAGSDFSRLQLGGTSASFPAIKRNGTGIDFRLANDSAFCGIAAASLNLNKTITAAATTGAQTINNPTGSVNFAAAATSLVVTNSLVTANSVINCTVGTDDSTMKSASAVAGAGSFTIYAGAAPTAETRVNFILTN